MKKFLLPVVGILALGASLAWAANNFRMSTSGGTVTTFKGTDNVGVMTPHVNVDTLTGGSVTADTELPAAAAAADATANPTAPMVLNGNMLFNGTTWDRRRAATGTTGVAAINSEGTKATYSAAGGPALAASATDVITFYGSGTKTIRVTRITLSGTATAATSTTVQLFRRSTTASGGTSSSPLTVAHDTTNAAATVAILQYTANPTPGTSAGAMEQETLNFSSASTLNGRIVWDYGVRNGQGIVLRGTSQGIAVSLAGATVTGGVLNYKFEWTEE
jgi:hypothetical protein